MFKGLAFILILGLVIVLVIVAVIVSFVYRTVHRVKKVLNGEDDSYNPEISKKHQHYTHSAYGRRHQASSPRQETSSSQARQDEHIHKSNTGEELYETRSAEQANRQIFTADEGEYVEFVEEH